ncbi:COG7 [Candida oxycetoniae]|uniref:COG7 n=1 Tax=Candida oxycetoniae TaxID=497107 RepID=A0AAI9WX70_9ASCO|nr:COG7 [Candida oxycetoniae]KAI3403942.1 COG7 [Candida oxycetoniae]
MADYTNTELISMFFDDEFNPSAFINMLIHKVTSGSQAYSKTSLSKVSHTINQLTTHLDYTITDIATNELQNKLTILENSNSLINSSKLDEDEHESLETTRLQYYINILNNSIFTLGAELAEINKQIDASNENLNNESIQTLIQLKQVKTNLSQVIQVFEDIIQLLSKNNIEKTTFSVEEFQQVLNDLLESIKLELNTQNSAPKNILLNHIDKLIQMQDLFTNMSHFNSPFKKFISRLIIEKEQFK